MNAREVVGSSAHDFFGCFFGAIAQEYHALAGFVTFAHFFAWVEQVFDA